MYHQLTINNDCSAEISSHTTQYTGKGNLVARDRGSTNSASTRRWGGDRIKSRLNNVITKDVKMVPSATMYGTRL